MSKMLRLPLFVILALMLTAAAPAGAYKACPAMATILSTPCVQTILQSYPQSFWYYESWSLADNGNGSMTMTCVMEPRCIDAPVPCRLASRLVEVTFDCKTGQAVCN